MTEDPQALIIMLVWLSIWVHLAKGGKDASPVTTDRTIQQYTTLVGVGFFFFYTFLFTGLGAVPFAPTPAREYLGWLLLSLGFFLIVVARHRLRHLSGTSVLFGLSEHTAPHAVDRYTFGHPMYVGMLLIACGSLCWFPNTAGALTLVLILVGLIGKARIENRKHRVS